MASAWETVKVGDSNMRVYVSRPEGSQPSPAVVVVPGQTGVQDFVKFADLAAQNGLVAAAGWYELVWRTDHAYVSAAFGLARVLLACGNRARAVEVLLSVPDTSSQHLAAQIAAVRAQLGHSDAEDLVAAGERLHALDIDVHSHTQLAAELLEAAFDYVTRNQAAEGKVLDCALSEHELRLGLERRYRTLARFAATPEERIALVDRANAVRPRTLV